MISVEEIGGVLVLHIEAVRLDGAVGTMLRNTVASKIDRINKVAVDISGVKLVDSGGLGSLVALLKSVSSHQGKLALVGMQKPVRMMFELSRMDRQFLMHDELSQALGQLMAA
jgi:anti-sigma B factor antagonist